MRKLIGPVAAIMLAISALGAPSASAATEFGDGCIGSTVTSMPSVTLFDIAVPANPLPIVAPTAGIITSWKVTSASPLSIPQNFRLIRDAGPKTVQVIAESAGTLATGANTFNVRIPVQAGDRAALLGTSKLGNLACITLEKNLIGGVIGGGGVGSTNNVEETTVEARIPVSATIEADTDNDGYGDETQDKCPQLASTQADCPVVSVDIATALKRKGSAVVLLTATAEAPVKVAGTISLGKGKKAKLASKAKTVPPGKVARFTLKFPKKLKKRLQELDRKQSLRLKIIASATDLIGRVTSDKLKVRLKGQASSPR